MSQLNPTVNLQFVDPRAAMEEALARLDPEQRAISDEIMAVDPQPLVALAGAGSGKSETMVTTVARILLDNVLSSTDVIVTTFTNKAREELDSRLQAMVPAVKRDGLRLGTFHALAQRWMRAADPQMPSHRWDNARNVDLIDEDDSQRTAGEVVRLRERIVTGIQRAGDRPNLRDHGWKAIVFLAAETSNESVARRVFTAREVFGDSSGKVFRRLWGLVGIPDAASIWRRVLGDWEIPGLELEGQTQYEKTLGREIPKFRRGLDVIVPNGRSARDYAGQVEIMRGKGWGPDSPEAQPTLDALDAVGYRKIRQGWRLYEEVKATFNAFDFGDVLEAYWLRGEDKARLVLVDEAQDNNFVQLDVARKVAERGGGKLCLIGDVRQAIYSFRGADPEVTARAPETIGAKVMEITTNYRSGQEIVRLGNAIAEGKSWAYGSPSRSGRRGQDGLPVPGAISATGYADPLEEARATAVLAREEILRGTSPSEVAVLTRTNAAAGVYELGFLMEQVPVMVLGSSVSFFERGVVKDALAFLILAEGYGGAPERLASLMRIWKTPIDSSKPFHFLGEGTFKAEAQAYAELATLPMMDAIIQSGIFTKDPSWRKSGEALRSALNRLCLTPWPERAKDVGRLLTNPPYLSKESSPEDLIDPEAVQQVDALASIAERFDNLTELLAFTRRIANSVLFFEGEDRMTKKQRAEWDAERKRRVVVSTVHKAKGLGWSRVFVSATSGIFPGPRASEEDMPEEERVFYVAATRAKLTADFTWAEKAGESGGGPSPFIENFVLPLTDAVGKLPPGWRLVSRFPLRYERADGVYVDLISEEGSHTLKATGAEIEPQVFGSQLDALDAVTDFLKALPLVEDEALEDAQHAEEPVNPQGLSDADGVFLTYLRTLTGEAAPGVTWAALADLLLADGILRGAVLAEVRQVVAARVEPEPDEIKERRIAAVLDTEVLSRAPVWVTLPGYPYLADRAGSGSLVADGRWVTVARPWRGAENPALLRVGSTVVLDFPMPDGTEWRSYQINEAGTPVPGASYLARPGKAGHEEFYASVHKAKAAVWSRDELAQWLVEHPLSDEEAKDARYLYEATAGLPIQVTKGKVEVPEADFDFQGRPRARLLNGIPVSRLAPLVEHGLLLQTSKGSYAISIGSAAPPAPKVAPPPAKK